MKATSEFLNRPCRTLAAILAARAEDEALRRAVLEACEARIARRRLEDDADDGRTEPSDRRPA